MQILSELIIDLLAVSILNKWHQLFYLDPKDEEISSLGNHQLNPEKIIKF